MKTAYEDAILLYMCTKNHDHMVYASWDMGAIHNFLSFWVIFCPFAPLLAPKIKNWKHIRRCFLFRMCTINKDSWDVRHNRKKYLSFWVIFYLFIPLTNQKTKILKKWRKKTTGNIIILHLSTMNDNHMMYGSWDMEYSRQNLSSFWTIFCPCTEKSNFWKKSLEIWLA